MKKGNVIPSNRAVLLFSGGLDSVTVLALLVAQGYSVTTLHFSYGQPAQDIEVDVAGKCANKYGASSHYSYQLDSELFIWRGGYCPARNLAFIGNAVAFTESRGIRTLALGLCQSVESPEGSVSYPDCTSEFVVSAQNLIDVAAGTPIKLIAPIHHLPKSGVIRTAKLLGVDLADTFSCLRPVGMDACGKCVACKEAKYALARV